MKNKKFKLFASLTSLVMVVAVMAVGVWAATQASVGVNTKVSFTATGFTGTVSIAYTNNATSSAETGTSDTYNIGAANNAQTWDLSQTTIAFAGTGEKAIEFTFTLTVASIAQGNPNVGFAVKSGETDLTQATNGTNVLATVTEGVYDAQSKKLVSTIALTIESIAEGVTNLPVSIVATYTAQ